MVQAIETGQITTHHPELPEGYTDALTGLPNRRWLEQQIAFQLGKNPGNFTLGIVDLEDFKTDNDRDGHAAGDEKLKLTGATLDENLRSEQDHGIDIERRSDPEQVDDQLGVGRTARVGGDEFIFILSGALSPEQLEATKLRLQTTLEEKGVRASIGMKSHQLGETRENLLKTADDRMYENKAMRKEERLKAMPLRKRTAIRIAGLLYKYADHPAPR
ncbi:MAG: GGDEF domain-containing protein [Patescibacteria group bacterium]